MLNFVCSGELGENWKPDGSSNLGHGGRAVWLMLSLGALTPDSDGSQFIAQMTKAFELYWATRPEGSLCENIDERMVV